MSKEQVISDLRTALDTTVHYFDVNERDSAPAVRDFAYRQREDALVSLADSIVKLIKEEAYR